jgi:sugar lactone lactonase YvrE
MTTRGLATLLVAGALCALPADSAAWDRERAQVFAILPDGSGGPEGLEVDPDGNVYVGSFGFTATGPIDPPGRIFVFDRRGKLLRVLEVEGSSANLLGLRWREATGTLLVADFGNAQVLEVDPLTGASEPFLTIPPPPPTGASLNDIALDAAGNVYVSDSFQGIVWRTGAAGGLAQAWVTSPLLQTTGVPPFGANGLRLNRDGTALFVTNTGNDTVVRVPVLNGGGAGEPEVFVHSINGADGLLVDDDDNLWVAANQADEIVVVDPTGKAIAKLGDFDGVRDGVPKGLLFPASLRFAGKDLLVTNLALDLRLFGLPPTIDSAWAAKVKRYTVSRLPARIPRDDRGHGHGGDGGDDDRDDRK